MPRAYRLLDVFTETPLAGNPLAVVLDADGLDDAPHAGNRRRVQSARDGLCLCAPRPGQHRGDPYFHARPRTALRRPPDDRRGDADRPFARASDCSPRRTCGWCWKKRSATSFASCAIAAVRRWASFHRAAPATGGRRRRRPVRDIAAGLGLEAADIGFGAHRPVVYGAGAPIFCSFHWPASKRSAGPTRSPPLGRRQRPGDLFLRAGRRRRRLSRPDVRSGWGISEDPATGWPPQPLPGLMRFRSPVDGEQTVGSNRASRWVAQAASHRPRDRSRRAGRRDDWRIDGPGRRRNARTVSGGRASSIDALDFVFPRDRGLSLSPRRGASPLIGRLRAAEQPRLFNGRVLVLGRHEIAATARRRHASRRIFRDRLRVLSRLARLRFSRSAVANAFAMAALRGSDGAFLLGEMAAHTANAGEIYFPAGTPDLKDVFDGKVDLAASALRELMRKRDRRTAGNVFDSDWTVVYAPPRIACLKIMRLAEPAETVKARIEAFLAANSRRRNSRDTCRSGSPPTSTHALMPHFVVDFFDFAFAHKSTWDSRGACERQGSLRAPALRVRPCIPPRLRRSPFRSACRPTWRHCPSTRSLS